MLHLHMYTFGTKFDTMTTFIQKFFFIKIYKCRNSVVTSQDVWTVFVNGLSHLINI